MIVDITQLYKSNIQVDTSVNAYLDAIKILKIFLGKHN
jgi:hypothetical protein